MQGVEEDWLAKGTMSRSFAACSIARRSGLLRRTAVVEDVHVDLGKKTGQGSVTEMRTSIRKQKGGTGGLGAAEIHWRRSYTATESGGWRGLVGAAWWRGACVGEGKTERESRGLSRCGDGKKSRP